MHVKTSSRMLNFFHFMAVLDFGNDKMSHSSVFQRMLYREGRVPSNTSWSMGVGLNLL